MPYSVVLTRSAARDLEELYDYIKEHDSSENAEYVLDKLEEKLDRLAEFPERGSYPKELSALGIREYRQVLFKPYRIIYRVVKNATFVYLIVDGRRDMEALLSRRLLDV